MVSFSWWPQVAQAERKDLTMTHPLLLLARGLFPSWPFEGLSSNTLPHGSWLQQNDQSEEARENKAKQKPASF